MSARTEWENNCRLCEDSWQLVASFLETPEILSLVSTCRVLKSLGRRDTFWSRLLDERYNDWRYDRASPKQAFLLQSHAHHMPRVGWCALRRGDNWPSDREGHLCALLGRSIVLTGGYSNDECVYVKALDDTTSNWERVVPQVTSQLAMPSFCYGASLTALDDHRAVRFGGFQSGGYSNETGQVAVLTLARQEGTTTTASWHVQPCRVPSPRFTWARAYHTATLLHGRYLMVTGGMISTGSIWCPVVLDTVTWTWHSANQGLGI
jgi:hypothetical protein